MSWFSGTIKEKNTTDILIEMKLIERNKEVTLNKDVAIEDQTRICIFLTPGSHSVVHSDFSITLINQNPSCDHMVS